MNRSAGDRSSISWFTEFALTRKGQIRLPKAVGNLERFPIQGETSKVLKITPGGRVTTIAIDFSTILGLAFDSRGRLYVLENTTGNLFPAPGTGKILRIDGKHQSTEITTGLNLPTAMTFGPDGNLYVSNLGFGLPPVGLGQVLKVTLP